MKLHVETFYEITVGSVLGVLAGKLCLMLCPMDGECEVWVMNEYGMAESWVKHHEFSQFSGDIRRYGFTSHNEFIFYTDGRFCLYDPIATQSKTVKITNGLMVAKIVEYTDSLCLGSTCQAWNFSLLRRKPLFLP
uniref:F-box associated domain-containing protein n=1 Tax=Lactuca sativa TaxID=4236 RepID=A0A9R1X0K5_LACSA|nr:hypothetical protein LSAT_V11C800398750 [Lactuca sativa]